MRNFERINVAMDYLRANWWRLFGARIGAKARIGPRCECPLPGNVTIGERSVLEATVVLKLVEPQARLVVGQNTFIGRGTIFDVANEVLVGADVLIAPGCFVTDHDHGIDADATIWQQACASSTVTIGAGAWLGAKVIVLAGVTIGDGAVVAAGAVVTRDVDAMTIVAGVPARQIGVRQGRQGLK